ncbi:hypothetical protein A1O7_06084 [Cladophialophora yegresii CBS 114405]|uniref:Uncharacterized protein n=1 Tax=Cladophialophora yegresii CBS 114405 TaxID=1182544 RepID=W9W2B6_9EURO|nr:uncharacterized protein A1O7_06084 [Cladophialophora yegresii CBS 114405]EXJ58656.1 hypothetical protein A1O7_06084 [Cladophialophora yegresii CBS 114405]
MSDPSGEYTYICSAGPRRSMVLLFSDGTPRQHRKDIRPDMVSTVKKPGTDESFYGNRVEGALFTCELRSGRMGGSKTVYWMIDPKWQSQKPDVGQRVGWATTVRVAAGANAWSMVPVWASDRWDLGTDSCTREKIVAMYYFQNDYGRGRPGKPCGMLDVPTTPRPRSRSETRYTVVQTWDREIVDDER